VVYSSTSRATGTMDALNTDPIFKPRTVPAIENDPTEDAYQFESVSSEIFENYFVESEYVHRLSCGTWESALANSFFFFFFFFFRRSHMQIETNRV
jgi:hypothetical protein